MHRVSTHAQGLDSAASMNGLRLASLMMLPSPCQNKVGTPKKLISELDGWPACALVNASPVDVTMAGNDSGPGRVASPFPYGSFIRYSLPVLTGAFSDPFFLLFPSEHYRKQLAILEGHVVALREMFPQVEILMEIHGIGLYSALLIVGELGEVDRFHTAKQVAPMPGLTVRVNQSGGHCYRGSITRQGSPWLRWILVEAAMKVVQEDVALKNFYTRVRKRSSANIARVATARKLAEICWKRLRRWQREHTPAAATA